ncbi:MAG TPA: hypothetical protein VL625_12775 [Patescibacteria group bacterium]|jgi:hypothetical protein|nr:hypothetical protein [Patescibacteria group bacterium]
MHLQDLSPYFQLRAKMISDMAVNFVLAAGGENAWTIREPKDFPVTPQFITAVSQSVSSDICEQSGEKHLPLPEGAWRTEEMYDVVRECLAGNDKIRPQFL